VIINLCPNLLPYSFSFQHISPIISLYYQTYIVRSFYFSSPLHYQSPHHLLLMLKDFYVHSMANRFIKWFLLITMKSSSSPSTLSSSSHMRVLYSRCSWLASSCITIALVTYWKHYCKIRMHLSLCWKGIKVIWSLRSLGRTSQFH
jgi:hypothetical protein